MTDIDYNEKLYNENDVNEFYAEQLSLDEEPDAIFAHYESWCAEKLLDPSDAASFDRYLTR